MGQRSAQYLETARNSVKAWTRQHVGMGGQGRQGLLVRGTCEPFQVVRLSSLSLLFKVTQYRVRQNTGLQRQGRPWPRGLGSAAAHVQMKGKHLQAAG